jgi:hypothetical protein
MADRDDHLEIPSGSHEKCIFFFAAYIGQINIDDNEVDIFIIGPVLPASYVFGCVISSDWSSMAGK